MANTFSSLYYHVVFSTKYRRNFLKQDKEDRIWNYLGGISKKIGASPVHIGGYDDHIHALLHAKPSNAPSKILNSMKGGSSRWIRNEYTDLPDFNWQDGYSIFSVSKSVVPNVVRYIENQRDHHSELSFQDEYRRILRLHEIDADERYLFG